MHLKYIRWLMIDLSEHKNPHIKMAVNKKEVIKLFSEKLEVD